MRVKPLPDTYWVVPGQFLAGSYPGSAEGNEEFTRRRLTALLEAGLDTFIDLTRPGETPGYSETLREEAARHNLSAEVQPKPIEDRGLPSPAQMVEILNSIDTALASGRKVYLHCLGGIGRTGTVVGCWLARHGLTGEVALARLNSLYQTSEQFRFFPRSPETDAQVLFVLDWKEALPSSSAAAARAKEEPVDWHERFLQQARWTRALRAYVFRRIGLQKANRVLEVGCGTGAILAETASAGALHGLDKDLTRLKEATLQAPRAVYTCAEARHLPYPPGTFQVTFCHFLLLWVPEPLEALREMVRVTGEGGTVIAFAEPNYRERVDRPAELAPLGRWQAESLLRQGADPDLGGRLASLFRQAGIDVIETGQIQESEEKQLSQVEWRQEWTVLEEDLRGIVPPEELRRLKRLDLQAWRKGERRLSVPTYFAWGRVGQMV